MEGGGGLLNSLSDPWAHHSMQAARLREDKKRNKVFLVLLNPRDPPASLSTCPRHTPGASLSCPGAPRSYMRQAGAAGCMRPTLAACTSPRRSPAAASPGSFKPGTSLPSAAAAIHCLPWCTAFALMGYCPRATSPPPSGACCLLCKGASLEWGCLQVRY
jgi:hypothetical protein